jgi:hypothetical protein
VLVVVVVPSFLAIGYAFTFLPVVVLALPAIGDAFVEFIVPVETVLANRDALMLLLIPTVSASTVNDDIRDTLVEVVVPVFALGALVVVIVVLGFGRIRCRNGRDETQEGSGEREDGRDMHRCEC